METKVINAKVKEEYMGIFDEILSTNIDDHTKFQLLDSLSKTILAGEKILNICVGKDTLKKHDIVVITLYRKILEQSDGIFILLDHDSNSGLTSTLRSLYETSIGFQFIFQDESLFEKRAISYYVSFIQEQLVWTKKGIKSGELSRIYSREELFKKIKKLEDTLKDEPLRYC